MSALNGILAPIATAAAVSVVNARALLHFIRLLINNFIYVSPTIAGKSFVTLTVKSNRVDGKFATIINDDNCSACEIRSALAEYTVSNNIEI